MRPPLPESTRLLYGPYRAPRCRVGRPLDCEARGRAVIVGGLSDAPISWPYAKKKGKRSLILCGDLVKAVAVESAAAVARHWGVSGSTVSTWRRALGVPRENAGSRRLNRHYLTFSRERSRTPEARAKMSAAHARRPPSPQFRAAARAAASCPKSEAWKRAMSQRLKEQWANGVRKAPSGRARRAPARDARPNH